MRKGVSPPSLARGFTLIEILIVVIILGILAGMVVPQAIFASKSAKESALRENLRLVRTQLIAYKQLHGMPAGYDAGGSLTSDDQFRNQLTEFTDVNGNTASSPDSTYTLTPLLPYFPSNPMNTMKTVLILSDGQSIVCDGTTGWIFKPVSQEFFPNTPEYGPGGSNW